MEELKSAVKDLDIKEDIVNFFVSSVESEKNRGILEKRRANDEAKGLRAYKKAFEGLGLDKDSDLDDFVYNIKDRLEAVKDLDPKKSSETEQELKKLRRDFDKAQTALEEERSKAIKIKQESDNKTLKSKITDAIREKVYGSDLVAENLIANGRVALEDDGSVSWIEGEDRKAFDDGIQRFIESRPDIVRNVQKGGAGSPPPSGEGNKTFSFEKVENMSRDEIRENLTDIKKSFGL